MTTSPFLYFAKATFQSLAFSEKLSCSALNIAPIPLELAHFASHTSFEKWNGHLHKKLKAEHL